jgi:cytochrome c2
MYKLLIGVSALAMAACPTAKAGAEDANVVAGRELAVQVCSVCHVVAPDQEFPPRLGQITPSFMEIANNPDISAGSLRKFIITTHWDEHSIPITMPDPMLYGDQIPHVISYILSLRKRP